MTATNSASHIERWLSRKPESATTARVSAIALGASQTVVELSAKEIDATKHGELAEEILDSTEAWAASRNKETSFLASWLDGERPVLSLPFRITPQNSQLVGLPAIDGSLESLIATLQATGIQQHRLMIDMAKSVVELILSVVDSQQNRIHFLEGQEIEVRRLKNELSDIATSNDDQRFNKITNLVEKYITARSPTASLPRSLETL